MMKLRKEGMQLDEPPKGNRHEEGTEKVKFSKLLAT
jgi:hypothetical protein